VPKSVPSSGVDRDIVSRVLILFITQAQKTRMSKTCCGSYSG
jgi:hypothetical protein